MPSESTSRRRQQRADRNAANEIILVQINQIARSVADRLNQTAFKSFRGYELNAAEVSSLKYGSSGDFSSPHFLKLFRNFEWEYINLRLCTPNHANVYVPSVEVSKNFRLLLDTEEELNITKDMVARYFENAIASRVARMLFEFQSSLSLTSKFFRVRDVGHRELQQHILAEDVGSIICIGAHQKCRPEELLLDANAPVYDPYDPAINAIVFLPKGLRMFSPIRQNITVIESQIVGQYIVYAKVGLAIADPQQCLVIDTTGYGRRITA